VVLSLRTSGAGGDGPEPGLFRRLVIVAGSLLATGVILWLTFMLGAWGFSHRRQSFHEGRLQRLVNREPQLWQVVEGLAAEGTQLLAAPRGEEELRRLASGWDERAASEVLAKGARWPRTRVFGADDMIYVLYFDERGVLRDYSCFGR
jgi:hypothetical protein